MNGKIILAVVAILSLCLLNVCSVANVHAVDTNFTLYETVDSNNCGYEGWSFIPNNPNRSIEGNSPVLTVTVSDLVTITFVPDDNMQHRFFISYENFSGYQNPLESGNPLDYTNEDISSAVFSILNNPYSFTFSINQTGTFAYHDAYNPDVMSGYVTVLSGAPVADFTYSNSLAPLTPIVNEIITFDGSMSKNGWNGSQSMPINTYAWNFGDNNTASGQLVTHAYADSGNYVVTLNVTDSEGLWNTSQRQVQIGQPNGPVAEFTASPETVLVGKAVDFNASSSIEGWNGTAMPIAEYLWDFGDGNVASSINSAIVHGYTYGGNFNVTLTVFDSENMSSSCSNTVLVIMPTSVSVGTSATSTVLGYSVNIKGTLSDIYGNAVGNEPVVLYYTFPSISSLFLITSTTTDNSGQYDAQWMPAATGSFCIVAEWAGNMTYSAASCNVTMCCIATFNQYVFSVESNSTITSLAFNTTSQELSFTATGPSGTTGYAKITIAKSLASNITNIRVYLDNNQTDYSITSTDDSWLLMFNYTHSTHTVRVNLSTSQLVAGHDVAVTSVTSGKTFIGQGLFSNVTVTIGNLGSFAETFNVTVTANQTVIATFTYTPLASGSFATLSFMWNTTAFAKGDYTISAYAGPVPSETNTANNNFTGGVVRVTIPGDLNGDFKVTLTDLVNLAKAYGSKPGDSNWNPSADIDGNNIVDQSDVNILALYYG